MEQQKKMVRVSVEVRSGPARFRVGVQVQSIREALSMVGGTYPRSEVGVAFPTGPRSFFVRERSAPTRVFGHEQIRREAA